MNDGSRDRTSELARAFESTGRVSCVDRPREVAGRGKGAVLNHAYEVVNRLVDECDPLFAEGHPEFGAEPGDIVIGVMDADGRLDRARPHETGRLFGNSRVGGVQIGVTITNAGAGLLPRCQDIEFVGFSHLAQAARDRIGSVGLGGNGQFTRLSALRSLRRPPWTDCLTEDLDLGLSLTRLGWRIRFCSTAWVAQEGVLTIRAWLRQRTRWAQGHYQCWSHFPVLLTTRRAPLIARLDLCIYLLFVVFVMFVTANLLFTIAGALGWLWVDNEFMTFLPAGPVRNLALLVLRLGPVVILFVRYQQVSRTRFLALGAACVRRRVRPVCLSLGDRQRLGLAEADERTRRMVEDGARRPGGADGMRTLVVVGTRPEVIKLAPVVHQLERAGAGEPILVATGQHRELVHQMLRVFGLAADIDLDVMTHRQRLADLTGVLTQRLGSVVDDVAPDWVVVQGDTTSALCAALAGFYDGVPVAHVEAGLRTSNVRSPFPEEANRRLVAPLASCTSARRHGRREPPGRGCRGRPDPPDREHGRRLAALGDRAGDAASSRSRRARARVACSSRSIAARTMAHRCAGSARPSRCWPRAATRRSSSRCTRIPPCRPSSVTALQNLDGVHLCEPLDYLALVATMASCDLVLTDSGGLQEEAPSLGKPVLVLRDTTERPEAIEAGVARLIGTLPEDVHAAASHLLDDRDAYEAMARAANPFGDGSAGQRIVAALAERHAIAEAA